MYAFLTRRLEKLRRDGLATILRRKIGHRWNQLRVNNHTVGRIVELAGNRVSIDGMRYHVDTPEIITSHKSTLWFGLHELEERALIRRWLPKDLPVVELGGGLGVVSCLANRTLARPADHIVVEANPNLVTLLRRNCSLNDCSFTVLHAALAYHAAMVTFAIQAKFLASRIGNEGNAVISVPATSLRNILDLTGFQECALICDIEGGEGALVEQEFEIIRDRCRFLLFEIHPGFLGQHGADQVVTRLLEAGFTLLEQHGWNWAFKKN